MYSLLISMCIAGCFVSFISASVLKMTASRHHLRPPPVPIMDAQWQQYYWNHYLLQQQQHQLASGTDAAQYTPTNAYGFMGHSIRMHQQHQAHPYTPPPSTSPPSHTPPPNTSPSFPPPPPPPLPTASPATPQQKPLRRVPLTRLHRHLLLQFHLQPQPSKSPGTPRIPVGTQTPFTDINSAVTSSPPNGPDVSGSQACRLLKCSLGYLRTMRRRTLQPGRSVTASFAGSFLRGVLPSQFSPGDSR